MGVYSSGSIHFGGLGSDIDVDELITNLYKVESKQAQQLISWRDDWQTRLDAFQTIRSQLLSLETTLNSLNSMSKFVVMNATPSNTSVTGATVTGEASAGTYNVKVNQTATSSAWSLETGVAAKTDVINDSGEDGSFSYSYKGKDYSVRVPNGTTLEGLKNIINNDSKNPGVKVQLIESTDGLVFQLRGNETGLDAKLVVTGTENINCLNVATKDLWEGSAGNTLTCTNQYTSADEVLNTTGTAKTFAFSVNGEKNSVKLAAGGTLQDLADAVNASTATSGVSASIVSGTSSSGETVYSLELTTADPDDELSVGGGTLSGYSDMKAVTNWTVQEAQNAEVRVDGWPSTGWLERSSNAIDGVVDGVTFNVRSPGDCVVSVEIDTKAIEENITTVVDSINSFRVLIQSLTAVDSEKIQTEPEYADSQFDMQMGGVLTGNYGVQMISSSFKNAVAGQAQGFTYLQEVGGKNYGDLFSSLSQIGIMTDSNQSSTTYGLLLIDGAQHLGGVGLTLEEALAQDPIAVAKLFVCDEEGVSNSPYFSYNSHVQTITKPGTYEVSYSTDVFGNISSATINGKAAQIDQENRQISIFSHGDGGENAADGLILDVYDLTPDQTFTGTVGIKQGKVNEFLDLMQGTSGWLGEEGTLKTLENNYKNIIENIEKKISDEDTRLEKWESSMRARFARLEATLAKYNQMNSDLESQIASLNNNS
ncbi:flagellar filament capping protein FliD [Desulfovibrio sp. OttesenSCG-928-G15]|nr:flagellar filament capping protein FliD [Desulfovibrio sp. OttesenSCG-928-G15]